MSELDNICYKKTFLNEVIIRLDFLGSLPDASVFDEGLEKSIRSHFPHQGKQQLIRFGELQLPNGINGGDGQQIGNKLINGIQIEYTDDNSNKAFVSNKSVSFEFKTYESFEKMMGVVGPVIRRLFSSNRISVIRTGIRYINIFENGRAQKSFFNSQVACALDAQNLEGNIKCRRSMNLTEFFGDGMNVNFRFGLYNPEYPKALSERSFVLDYDCFTNDLYSSFDGVMSFIGDGHGVIQALFERSITDKLREFMKDE